MIRMLRLPMRDRLRTLNEEQPREREIEDFKRQYFPTPAQRRVNAIVHRIVSILAVIGGLVVLGALMDALG